MRLEKYSLGIGDRFAHQAKAQLRAFQMAAALGAEIVPVWNKSHREHTTIGSSPSSVRAAADAAVQELEWKAAYYIDADHIRQETVDGFVSSSDFYTIDVADSIGQTPSVGAPLLFVDQHPELVGTLVIPGIEQPFETTRIDVERIASKYLAAAGEAGRIYNHICSLKGEGNFVTEVSMDETDAPQTPPELLVILAALADTAIPLQTIAPKFTGRFNKGVDYVGNIAQFEKEFSEDLAVIEYAVRMYGLPENLKLSVHSGSDKFSIYAPIRRSLARFGAGVHLKTAGTTWLEELIGLAEAGGDGLDLAAEIYTRANAKREALCAPYASVIDIDPAKLPDPVTVQSWTSEQYVSALRHDQSNPNYNPSLRQLLHVGYKIAADMGDRYLTMLDQCEETISKNVTYNLYRRHITPLFLAELESGI
jgi:tagaturonate epimerase